MLNYTPFSHKPLHCSVTPNDLTSSSSGSKQFKFKSQSILLSKTPNLYLDFSFLEYFLASQQTYPADSKLSHPQRYTLFQAVITLTWITASKVPDCSLPASSLVLGVSVTLRVQILMSKSNPGSPLLRCLQCCHPS